MPVDRLPTLRQVPTLTAEQMREVDRIMVDDLHIDLVQMMENAGRNLADLAITRYAPASAVVLAGGGGNGGGGLVAARHLGNRGVEVTVVLATEPARMSPVARHQLDILERIGIGVAAEPPEADLVIDALVGYSLRGNPHGRVADLIRRASRQASPVLSLDTPSGLDVTSGVAGEPCIKASATLTLALPKTGLFVSPELVGELYLADISVPALVYRRLGVEVLEIFKRSTLVRVDTK